MNHMSLTFIAVILASLVMAGCGQDSDEALPATTDEASSLATIYELTAAKGIKLTKKVVSIRDVWTVEADGKVVGKIEGKLIRLLGNVWLLTNEEGHLVDIATEDILTLSHDSDMYDYNGVKRGSMRKKVIAVRNHFTSDNIKADQKLVSVTTQIEVNGKSGGTLAVKKSLQPVKSVITIRPNGASSEEVLDTIWLAIIVNQIESS